ncbi:probable beta-hexosaminidase fdl isoform X2 [Diabrotica virgifera virgifera]|uniref:Beta-hexosaminidase n=1 Tax=Diabrotica virgifera virgifera TaxID=50390 RepID=A0A6P7F5Y1_DIAVI|nr:probable beta-hexosaminidase fdl isoform X2 [Diabrotica virgifera virgifera]
MMVQVENGECELHSSTHSVRSGGRMKQGELRRALLLVIIFCIFLFFYLYWQQSTKNVPTVIYDYKHVHSAYKKSNPSQWTWDCINQRCERRYIKETQKPVSLATCSMLCGSTQLWPQPTGPVTLGSKALTFNHNHFKFESDVAEPARVLLQEAFALFNDNVISLVERSDYVKEKADLTEFLIKVNIGDAKITKLTLQTDESYTLVVKPLETRISANITAKTFFGARSALETLSQLIWWDPYTNDGILKVIKGATVKDKPTFSYRGLMVDTSRNFMSTDSLRRVLEGMAASKLNVFHWHVTDSQSFPLEVPSLPLLSKTGSYSPEMTYSPAEVKDLVHFARVRGIRVILEVDTPAHVGNGWAWGPTKGLGELAVCINERPWSLYCGEPPCGQLNPDNPRVYEILEKLYKDLLDLSDEDEIFHIGGDEVNLECWSQHLQKSSTVYNFTDLHDLWGEFTVKAMNKLTAANAGKQIPHVIIWSSKLTKRPYITKYLNKSQIVVQSWGASQWSDTPDLLSDGYKIIISHVDAWYLDCGFGRWRETGEAACDPYRPWQTVYNHRPWQQQYSNKKLILGGEACLWSEQFDEGSLDARLWPRAAAFAERMWSDPQIDLTTLNIQEDVYTRLNTHRDRLVKRGLRAEALWPEWCVQNPGMCL